MSLCRRSLHDEQTLNETLTVGEGEASGVSSGDFMQIYMPGPSYQSEPEEGLAAWTSFLSSLRSEFEDAFPGIS